MSNPFPTDAIEDARSTDAAEKREREGEPGTVFTAWNRLNRVLVRDLPDGISRAERSRRRIARLH